jgi:methylenetetrahydrofolate reductase (NADPH)
MFRHLIDGLHRVVPFGRQLATDDGDRRFSDAMGVLVANLHYEIVPMSSIDQAIHDLPPGADVSVTCSPAKGIAATQEATERVLDTGHRPIPHLAARLVEGPDHAAKLASWLREHDLREVFVVAGDAPDAAGPYEGALPFMRDLIDADPGVDRIGIAGYPDGSAVMDEETARAQLRHKQALLAEHGLGGWISTQMCFDPDTIRRWLETERADGVVLPVRLGIPGVVDRTRLMTMGTRLGIGHSLRYLSKNRSTVMHLMAPGGYDPTDLVAAFADDAEDLGIESLHSFTFNSVADTRAWQEAIVAGMGSG